MEKKTLIPFLIFICIFALPSLATNSKNLKIKPSKVFLIKEISRKNGRIGLAPNVFFDLTDVKYISIKNFKGNLVWNFKNRAGILFNVECEDITKKLLVPRGAKILAVSGQPTQLGDEATYRIVLWR